jgi:hypothetical protein
MHYLNKPFNSIQLNQPIHPLEGRMATSSSSILALKVTASQAVIIASKLPRRFTPFGSPCSDTRWMKARGHLLGYGVAIKIVPGWDPTHQVRQICWFWGRGMATEAAALLDWYAIEKWQKSPSDYLQQAMEWMGARDNGGVR